MDRALAGNREQPLPLLAGQISRQADLHLYLIERPGLGLARDTILGMDLGVRQGHLHRLEQPMLALRIHSHRDAGARPEGGQKELVGVRPRIHTTDLARLVCEESMAPDNDFFDVR